MVEVVLIFLSWLVLWLVLPNYEHILVWYLEQVLDLDFFWFNFSFDTIINFDISLNLNRITGNFNKIERSLKSLGVLADY